MVAVFTKWSTVGAGTSVVVHCIVILLTLGSSLTLRAADLYIDPNAGGSVRDGHIYRS